MTPADGDPHIVVMSSLFPSARQAGAGLFIRERMFRLGRRLPLCVVSPTPWFPLQRLIARWRPGFRPGAAPVERQGSHDVWFPRFFSVPGVLKRIDGLLMALGAWPRLRRLQREGRLDILDAHFGYPDGYAAVLVGRWLGVPVTITLRGTESRHARDPVLKHQLTRALDGARRVFAVSESLRQVAISLGTAPSKVRVIGNGVDIDKFFPTDRAEARRALDLPEAVPVIVSVGGLCERKGFHRVLEVLPELIGKLGDVRYLIVGGPSPEGDWTDQLKRQCREAGLHGHVSFLGPVEPANLRRVLSAADVFVLATRNEGWANVFLEAMACGLPVVTTDVGGNAEVVCDPALGEVVPFGDPERLRDATQRALTKAWDRAHIRAHAMANTWDRRIDVLESEFRELHATGVSTQGQALVRAGRPVN